MAVNYNYYNTLYKYVNILFYFFISKDNPSNLE
jgi:hypothetical protein